MEIKHCTKDSLFKGLFKEPENLLQLYQFLHPEDRETSIEDIRPVTLNSLFIVSHLYNDLGFMVGDRL